MKRTISSLKSVPLSTATLVIAITCGLLIRNAQAGYRVTLHQGGSNVVAGGKGVIDLTGLTFNSSYSSAPFAEPSPAGFILTGSGGFVDQYNGALIGPTNFGSGFFTPANSGTGDLVGLSDFYQYLNVPQGYSSGASLSDSATYHGQTLSSMGVTPGTYEWTWGTGPNQNFTLDAVGAAAAPDSGSTFGLLFLALLALFGAAKVRSRQLA